MELTTTTSFIFHTLTFTSTQVPRILTLGTTIGLDPTHTPLVETIIATTVVTLPIVSIITLNPNAAFKSRTGASLQTAPFPTDDSSIPKVSASASGDRKLAYILPAVFTPLLFACLLVYIIYRRRQRRLSRQNATIIPIAFETPDDQHLMTVQNNSNGRLGKFISVRGLYHDASASHSQDRDISGNNGGNRNGVGEATLGVALERNAGTNSVDAIPVTRAELLDLRNRVADIEARQVTDPPPPRYY